MKPYGRVIPAMVTPFNADGSVDYGRARDLARHLIDLGCDGILVGGTTAESPVLDAEEKTALYRTVIEAVGDKVWVWAGTGTNNTADSIEMTRRAEAEGVDGVMLVAPYYNKPPQEGLYQHFKAIAETTRLPVMLYNVPGRTGSNIAPETVARLAAIDNIVAIKEASGSLDQVSQIVAATPDEFLVYSGDDSLTLPILAVGGHGVVSVAAHVVGDKMAAMVDAFEKGDTARAREIHISLLPIFKALFVTTNPIPVKAALGLSGFDVGGYRLPLVPLSEPELETVRRAMLTVGLINAN